MYVYISADTQLLLERTEWGSMINTRALDIKRRLDRLLWQQRQTTESNNAGNRLLYCFFTAALLLLYCCL